MIWRDVKYSPSIFTNAITWNFPTNIQHLVFQGVVVVEERVEVLNLRLMAVLTIRCRFKTIVYYPYQ